MINCHACSSLTAQLHDVSKNGVLNSNVNFDKNNKVNSLYLHSF